MRERARLLRDGPHDAVWLDALEETMAAEGVAIAAARPRSGRAPRSRRAGGRRAFSARPACPWPAPWRAGSTRCRRSMPRSAARRRWRRAGRPDAEAGGAATGPHRSDLAVRHAGKGMPPTLLLDRRAEGAADRHPARPRPAAARRARRAAAPAARRGRGASRRARAARAVRRSSRGSAARPGSAAPTAACSRRCAAPPVLSPSTTALS